MIISSKKAKAWIDEGGKMLPTLDHQAYDRMAQVLLDGMCAVDASDTEFERTNLLIRTLAISMVATFPHLSNEELDDHCRNVGAILAQDALSFRRLQKSRAKKKIN